MKVHWSGAGDTGSVCSTFIRINVQLLWYFTIWPWMMPGRPDSPIWWIHYDRSFNTLGNHYYEILTEMNIHKKDIPQINQVNLDGFRFRRLKWVSFQLLEQGWLFERDGYLFDYTTWKETGAGKFDAMKNMKSRHGNLQPYSRNMQRVSSFQ